MDRITFLKVFGLIIGCAAKFVTGSLFVFNAYQNDIKQTFNYTQKEVEAMSALLNVGLGIGFVPGMFYDRFGPEWTSAVGLVVSVTAYMLLWSTTRSVHFYSNNSWLMVIYFLLCGFGSVFTYMVALNTNIINFDKKHTGKIVGLLNAFFAGSPSVYAAIYYNIFPTSTTPSIAKSNLAGMMLMFAICFGVVDILCILFLRRYDDNSALEFTDNQQNVPGTSDGNKTQINNIESIAYDSISIPSEDQDKVLQNFANKRTTTGTTRQGQASTAPSLHDTPLSMMEILLQVDYQIFIWMVACATTVGLVFVNNVTVFSKSLGLDSNDKYLTLIIPITNTLLSAGVGLVSDLFRHKLPRIWFIMFACVCLLTALTLAVLGAHKIGLLMLATTLVGCSIGILWSVSPTIMKEMYYVGNLGRNWGITILLAGLLGLGAQELFGALYDDAISTPGSTYCYGMKCIRGGLSVCIGLAIVAIILGVVTQVRRYCIRQNAVGSTPQ